MRLARYDFQVHKGSRGREFRRWSGVWYDPWRNKTIESRANCDGKDEEAKESIGWSAGL
jgi:hypothetical protein